jgi:hypothetical protein
MDGHKITSCHDSRIPQLMSTVENATSSANLERVLNAHAASDLSMVMVQYGIPGVSLSKSRKIALIQERCERAVPVHTQPVARTPQTPIITQQRTPVSRSPAVQLPPQRRRQRNHLLAKSVCDANFAQAKILYGRVVSGLITIEMCAEQYNSYRRSTTLSVLNDLNGEVEDYSMVCEEMARMGHTRTMLIAHKIFVDLSDYGRYLRSSTIPEAERGDLLSTRSFVLAKKANRENLLSPNERDHMLEELRRFLARDPIRILTPQTHLKPLCIEVKKSSVKIDDVLQRDAVEECMICMTNFDSKDADKVPLMMGCEHICCVGCFSNIAKSRTKSFITCPFCRSEVSECTAPNKETTEMVSTCIKIA